MKADQQVGWNEWRSADPINDAVLSDAEQLLQRPPAARIPAAALGPPSVPRMGRGAARGGQGCQSARATTACGRRQEAAGRGSLPRGESEAGESLSSPTVRVWMTQAGRVTKEAAASVWECRLFLNVQVPTR
ncbi:hypothetical protein E2C01_005204 [Portunus trituberculatus]|uniref:Uncharacterized protein n=1 Tax=Portunus trituberculatus TaxID=210409 RepID=A0A5B7CTE0_PORTR|nr:hypothetical protein [Portunus trituberculatus]